MMQTRNESSLARLRERVGVRGISLLFTCLLLAAPPLHAATPASAPASVADEYTQGEIRKIDSQAGKVTLKHDEIRNLGMPPMAMVFEMKDPSVLGHFKAGDKVRFRAVKLLLTTRTQREYINAFSVEHGMKLHPVQDQWVDDWIIRSSMPSSCRPRLGEPPHRR